MVVLLSRNMPCVAWHHARCAVATENRYPLRDWCFGVKLATLRARNVSHSTLISIQVEMLGGAKGGTMVCFVVVWSVGWLGRQIGDQAITYQVS